MVYYIFKVAISSVLIVAILETAKRSTLAGSLLASIPFVSVLAMIWLYVETKDVAWVSDLSSSIFWLVIPSLIYFISMPMLLKINLNFYIAMGLSAGLTVLCYLISLALVDNFLFDN